MDSCCVCSLPVSAHKVCNLHIIIFQIIIPHCSICPVLNCFTLSTREPTNTRKQPGKGHADYLLAICQDSARARASVLCACVSGACVCLLEEPLNGGGGALRTSALLTGNNLQ